MPPPLRPRLGGQAGERAGQRGRRRVQVAHRPHVDAAHREACDLLGPNGELIHVKQASGSSPLSHLFAQGVTSYDALRYDARARGRFRDLVRAQPGGVELPEDFRPRTVVYAFAQVALYQAVKTLRAEGVDVEVVAIPPA
ncbi:DUF6119 family protein [Micromonospora sp. DT227]|uniref:DUF6119 family protein n=1 Tax=Micromonospora sp. DT227 TaxID=3393433 RepID=UPI003CF95550